MASRHPSREYHHLLSSFETQNTSIGGSPVSDEEILMKMRKKTNFRGLQPQDKGCLESTTVVLQRGSLADSPEEVESSEELEPVVQRKDGCLVSSRILREQRVSEKKVPLSAPDKSKSKVMPSVGF